MKTNSFGKKAVFFASCVALGFLASCADDEETFTAADSADVVAESVTEVYFNELDDMSLAAIEDETSPANSGRVSSDSRFCAGISIEVGSTETSGVITIDFGTGCTGPGGNVRTGKIILTYSNGPATTIGFTVVTTLENYTINGVALEGTRTIKRVASTTQGAIKHEITLADGRATWPDETSATRASDFTREITDGTVRLDGEAEGANRRGRAYTMEINETLVYDIACAVSEGIYMPVDGRKTFTSGNRQMIVDYGDGTCDRSMTVQIGNVSSSVSLN